MATNNMNIIITTRKQHPVSDEALYALFQQSFQKWHDSGIDAPFLHHHLDKFKRITGKDPIFIAIDTDSNELVGMICIRLYKKKKYAFDYFVAVLPVVRHHGIATSLLRHACDCLRTHGYKYMKDTTSAQASWSVGWHLKNGYRIKGYSMGRAPYSGSYQFRLQLAPFSWRHPSTWLWNKPLAPITARLCYLASYTVAQLVHHRNGELNWIGRLGKKLMDDVRG